jgi:peptidoglycan/LPS O-acetylase OafA/YrhL
MADANTSEFGESLDPRGKTPSWRVLFRPVIAVSLAVMILLAVLATYSPQPTPVPLIAPALMAFLGLRARKLPWRVLAAAVVSAAILSGIFWAAFSAVHEARWSVVADALCPVAALAVGFVLERTTLAKARA